MSDAPLEASSMVRLSVRSAELAKRPGSASGEIYACLKIKKKEKQRLLFSRRFALNNGQILAVAPVFPGTVVHFRVVAEYFRGEIKDRGALADVAVTDHQVAGF